MIVLLQIFSWSWQWNNGTKIAWFSYHFQSSTAVCRNVPWRRPRSSPQLTMGVSRALPAGLGGVRSKTDISAFQTSSSASFWDLLNIGDLVCRLMFAEFRGGVGRRLSLSLKVWIWPVQGRIRGFNLIWGRESTLVTSANVREGTILREKKGVLLVLGSDRSVLGSPRGVRA